MNNSNNEEKQLAQLLKQTGKRQQPSRDAFERVRPAVTDAWRDAVRAEKKRRVNLWYKSGAIAATLLVSVAVVMYSYLPSSNTDSRSAQIVGIAGSVFINEHPASNKQKLNIGDAISTNQNTKSSILLADKTLLVLDGQTKIILSGDDNIFIEYGHFYFDSPADNGSIVVTSQWGTLRDIGTQYDVRITEDQFEIAMRDGKVQVNSDGNEHLISAQNSYGEVLRINQDKQVSRSTIATDDDSWNWSLAVTPPLNTEGISAQELIDWTARTTGKKVNYKTPIAEFIASKTQLSGGEVDPSVAIEVLPALLQSTTLSAIIEDGEIRIEYAPN